MTYTSREAVAVSAYAGGSRHKRAGETTLIACLAWHNKEAEDERFIKFSPVIKRGATDERNFVKKAVNWALRNIGKRNGI